MVSVMYSKYNQTKLYLTGTHPQACRKTMVAIKLFFQNVNNHVK